MRSHFWFWDAVTHEARGETDSNSGKEENDAVAGLALGALPRGESFEEVGDAVSGPSLEEKLAQAVVLPGTAARCTTKQLKERAGIIFSGDTAIVNSMSVSHWKRISKDTWERVDGDT